MFDTSVLHGYHFLFQFYVTEDHRFPSIPDLVQHHSKAQDGLIFQLLYPAPKPGQMTFPNFNIEDCWEIDRTEITMQSKLGSGQYGDVYEAVWKRYNGVTVAVKTIRVSFYLQKEI